MSLDDWAVRNIEEAAKKQFFGDDMKDHQEEALDTLFEIPHGISCVWPTSRKAPNHLQRLWIDLMNGFRTIQRPDGSIVGEESEEDDALDILYSHTVIPTKEGLLEINTSPNMTESILHKWTDPIFGEESEGVGDQ